MGQKMRESASAIVTPPGLSKGSSVSIVLNGSSGPFQPRVCLDLDWALMPPPKYFPERVARSQVTSEDQPMDGNGSMMYDDHVPIANVAYTGDNVAIDEQDEVEVIPQAAEELEGIMSLESELHGPID
ncbi:hypothetical protein BG000_009650 [Podila horticola]|nr:hypothetical protein BG000_009650 [Podila horticola]